MKKKNQNIISPETQDRYLRDFLEFLDDDEIPEECEIINLLQDPINIQQ